MMDKVLFTIKPHSIIDVITNSSSELFVGKSQSKEELEGMIMELYPNYLSEYENLKATKELSNDELDMYISYHYHSWSNSQQSQQNLLIPGFELDEMYEFKNGKYSLRYNEHWDFVTNENREKVINGIDPNDEMYFLFSAESNPNWEMQEKLWDIMTRYHLG